jgi:hypothetical protein
MLLTVLIKCKSSTCESVEGFMQFKNQRRVPAVIVRIAFGL